MLMIFILFLPKPWLYLISSYTKVLSYLFLNQDGSENIGHGIKYKNNNLVLRHFCDTAVHHMNFVHGSHG